MIDKKEMIQAVYEMLKNRSINPSGKFEHSSSTSRWHATHDDLINVREPSRTYPWSEMSACRSKKYVAKVCEKFNCKTVEELRNAV